MILTGPEIIREWKSKKIDIRPFNLDQVNPNSYDFRLGATLKTYTNYVLDPRLRNPTVETTIPEEGLVLMPGRIYLGHTHEIMGSDFTSRSSGENLRLQDSVSLYTSLRT